MEEMNESATQQVLGKNSQAARFRKIIKQTRYSLIVGAVLLVLLIIANVSYISISQEELESSLALKQYRMGSKTLTAAVQSYAVTGDEQYYDAYMKELNVDKNRDTAWEILQDNDIKPDEWADLNEIAGLSNGLVPLEQEAMAAIAEGNTKEAVEFVFGSEYAEAIQRISDLTDYTIDKILDRLKAKKTRFMLLEIMCIIAFVAAFIRQAHDSSKAIRFAAKELLVPIIKVSGQMSEIANGNLDAELELERDDSEVGIMVSSIDHMKNNMANMLEDLKKAAESAIKAEQAKSRFLSSMSHEIRTPVNAILGMNEMIIRECTDSQLLTYAGNIQNSGKTLLTLINDILDISKIESGKLEIIPTEYKIAELLLDLWNAIYLRAKDKNLTLSFTLDETMPGTLYGDDVRVKQIITNLLTNAVKYTPSGDVKLNAYYEKHGDDTITLIISVSDTGIGIREEDMDKLFEKFQRIDEDKNRHIEGTGLGMSITTILLKLMNGDISVESVYQEGSTFTVRIPQKVIDIEPVGDFETIRNSQPRIDEKQYDSFEAPEANILVVDDNALNLVVFTSFLKQSKMNIVTAESGRKCLELVKEQPFHIIFMDHLMPEMDGVETFHEIQKLKGSPNENTPVIVLTANAISGAREYFMEEGFTDFLSKPIDSIKLEQMIVSYLPDELVHEKDNEVRESSTEGDIVEENSKENDAANESGSKDYSRYQEYGIYIENGIFNLAGNWDLYFDIVEMFIEDKDKQEQLKQFMEEQNSEDYGTMVHAVKGDAYMLGAQTLGDMAYEHEKQSKAGNLAYVEEHWDELIECWDRTMAGLEMFYRENGRAQETDYVMADPVTDEEGQTYEITQEEIAEVVSWLDAFESIKAEEKMKEWLQKPLKPGQQMLISDALSAAEKEFNYEKAIEILKNHV
ncbi:MAG: response regulator [Lachnospiraceae bacterium]|nr:response regulator [Lachnospiraceae bacterium]